MGPYNEVVPVLPLATSGLFDHICTEIDPRITSNDRRPEKACKVLNIQEVPGNDANLVDESGNLPDV